MDIRQPANDGVIRYRESQRSSGAKQPEVRRPTKTELRVWTVFGTHPEITERLWGVLAAHLPAESRQVVLGAPSLVCHESGRIFAIGFGTNYALRVPAKALRSGSATGFKTETRFSDGTTLNLRTTFGPEWVFGEWSAREEEWCTVACDADVEQATTEVVPESPPGRGLFHYLLLLLAVAAFLAFVVFFTSALHERMTPKGIRSLVLAVTVFLTGVAALDGYGRKRPAPAARFFGLLVLQPVIALLIRAWIG